MRFFKVVLSIIIILTFILVGTPIKYNCLELNIAIILIGTVFAVYKIFVKKEKVLNSKIDLILLCFYISPIIPLIFGKAANTKETLIAIVRNVSLFNLYFTVKNIIEKENIEENWLINAIIVGGVLLLILGIDERFSKTIFQYTKYIGIPNVTNIEGRMFSTLGYANSFAVLMAIEIFLCIHQFKKNKILYSILIGAFSIGLILSYSRGVITLFAVIFIAYIIIAKKARIRTVILSILFLIAVYLIGIRLDIPLHIFDNGEINKEVRYKLYNIEKGTEYCFKFNVGANVVEDIDFPVYSIRIAEENKYYDTVDNHIIQIGNFEGDKEITFTTSNDTVAMVIFVESNFPRYQNGLTINSAYINNKKLGLNYLYLPEKIVERVKSFVITNKSLWERFVFFKDGFKIIKQNMLFGTGAKGWQYNYKKVQEYAYSATEVHNYYLQIFIENGIMGFLLLISIIVYIMSKILKKKNITGIDMAFILLILHSFMDFDMSFYVVMVVWILLFTIIGSRKNVAKKDD